MRFVRTLLISAVIAVLTSIGLAGPAEAATTKRSGSCKLSANWTVGVSATWYGSQLHYTVMSSPGPLHVATQFPPLGNSYSYAFNPEQENKNFQSQGTAPPYVYRAFHGDPTSASVLIFVYGGNGTCDVRLNR